jgi:hypothetical protein
LLKAAQVRARAKGIPFDLQIEDIIVPEYCPVLGIKLEISVDLGGKPASPSLDRTIPKLGYVRGNVQVISAQANAMKRDASPEQLKRFCEYYLKVLEDL